MTILKPPNYIVTASYMMPAGTFTVQGSAYSPGLTNSLYHAQPPMSAFVMANYTGSHNNYLTTSTHSPQPPPGYILNPMGEGPLYTPVPSPDTPIPNKQYPEILINKALLKLTYFLGGTLESWEPLPLPAKEEYSAKFLLPQSAREFITQSIPLDTSTQLLKIFFTEFESFQIKSTIIESNPFSNKGDYFATILFYLGPIKPHQTPYGSTKHNVILTSKTLYGQYDNKVVKGMAESMADDMAKEIDEEVFMDFEKAIIKATGIPSEYISPKLSTHTYGQYPVDNAIENLPPDIIPMLKKSGPYSMGVAIKNLAKPKKKTKYKK